MLQNVSASLHEICKDMGILTLIEEVKNEVACAVIKIEPRE